MSKFFAIDHIKSLAAHPCKPWEFQPTEKITEQIRQDKESRQQWYYSEGMRHQFYYGIEPLNVSARINKESNQAFCIQAFVADYDVKIPDARIDEAVRDMDLKPTWIERSLGGKTRLVWELEERMLVDGHIFCTFVLQKAVGWLRLNLLPGLDEPSFCEPTRTYCNGCVWRPASKTPIPASAAQAFLVKCGTEFNFKGTDLEVGVPLADIEIALKEKYPNFDWPGAFEEGTQGPSFWIPESASPKSAIVRKGGMTTFSAHAKKLFYSWAEIISAEFIKNFSEESISRATKNIFYDNKQFWRDKHGIMSAIEVSDLDGYLGIDCKLSTKKDSTGYSPLEQAKHYIRTHNDVASAGPYCFMRPGLIVYQGKRRLNTWHCRPIEPAVGKQKWGPHGDFAPWCLLLDKHVFNLEGVSEEENQLTHYLAWWKRFYESALNWEPAAGHNLMMFGRNSRGKTFTSIHGPGASVGGSIDASDRLMDRSLFDSHFFEMPLWRLDDDSPLNSAASIQKVQAILKKMAANQDHTSNEKFIKSGQISWTGRIVGTVNMDFVSSRIMGGADPELLMRTGIFCWNAPTPFPFLSNRKENEALFRGCLPNLLRWIVDWEVPDFIKRHSRYGFEAFHEKTMMLQLEQTGYTSTFKELLIEVLYEWFNDEKNAESKYWEGTTTQLLKMIHLSSAAAGLPHSHIKGEQVNKMLEHIEREKLFKCETLTGSMNVRLWRFYREHIPAASGVCQTCSHNLDLTT